MKAYVFEEFFLIQTIGSAGGVRRCVTVSRVTGVGLCVTKRQHYHTAEPLCLLIVLAVELRLHLFSF